MNSRYRLGKEVSRGPAASIYHATDLESGGGVVIKVFQRRYHADPRFALRFREHMRRIAALSHENIIAILDYGIDEGHYYIVMERIEGFGLANYIAEHGALPPAVVIFVARQICAALDAIHQHGLIHRGIKPKNILLTPDGQVKVTDVGLSGLLSESGLSKTNVMMEGVNYISPEQARGKSLGLETDIYSLGVTLFELLTGRLPFESNDAWSLVRMHARDEAPSPKLFNPNIPADVTDIVIRALQKSPDNRYANAGEMDAALAALQEDDALMGTSALETVSGRCNWIAMLRALLKPDSLKSLFLTPTNLEISGHRLSFGVVLAFQFILTFLIVFVIVDTLAGL